MTPASIANEGSVSKLVTATAILKLVEAGKVDLDAPVTRYLPDFHPKTRLPAGRAITVRDLMTHHSGLPSDYLPGFEPGTIPPPGYPEPFTGNVARASSLFLTTSPGTAFSYSNLAVSLLGVIVERVSGRSFEDFCQAEVFLPLGMHDSSFVLPPGFAQEPRYAQGRVKGEWRSIPYIRDIPAGALNSTALDMARFTTSYLAAYRGAPGVLSSSSVKQMFTVQNPGVEADVGFQIGLNFWIVPVDQLPGERVVGHGGDLDPYHALVLLLPDRGLAVNIQANSIEGIGSFTLADIASQALRAAVRATGQTPIAPAATKAPSVVPAPAEVARWSGTYSSPLGVVRVRPQGRGIQVFLMGLWLDGVPRADGSIGLEARVVGLKLPIAVLETISLRPTTVDGKPVLALLIGALPYGVAVRVEPEAPSAAWKARMGTYKASNPTPGDVADLVQLSVDPNTGVFLFGVRAFGQMVTVPVHPLSDTEAVTIGYGRNLGETLAATDQSLAFGGSVFTREK
jgi:CubicO group peptidase (beta-lactamase class C family)